MADMTWQHMPAGNADCVVGWQLTRTLPQKDAAGGDTAGSRMISSFHAASATNHLENSAFLYSSLCCTPAIAHHMTDCQNTQHACRQASNSALTRTSCQIWKSRRDCSFYIMLYSRACWQSSMQQET